MGGSTYGAGAPMLDENGMPVANLRRVIAARGVNASPLRRSDGEQPGPLSPTRRRRGGGGDDERDRDRDRDRDYYDQPERRDRYDERGDERHGGGYRDERRDGGYRDRDDPRDGGGYGRHEYDERRGGERGRHEYDERRGGERDRGSFDRPNARPSFASPPGSANGGARYNSGLADLKGVTEQDVTTHKRKTNAQQRMLQEQIDENNRKKEVR